MPRPGRLRIVAGEDHHLGMLEHIVPDRILIGLAQGIIEAPDVLGAPVIAFPAVGVAHLLGPPSPAKVFADHVEEIVPPEVQGLQISALAVTVGLHQNGLHRAVFLANALELIDDDVERLIPTDPRIAAAAPLAPGLDCQGSNRFATADI